MMDEYTSRRSIVNEVTNFIDKVTDSKTLTDDMLEDFYLGVSSYGPLVDVTVTRMVKEVNPDPLNPGETFTAYVVSDNIYEWNQGDFIKVDVEIIGYTGTEQFVMNTVGLMLPDFNYSEAGRIR